MCCYQILAESCFLLNHGLADLFATPNSLDKIDVCDANHAATSANSFDALDFVPDVLVVLRRALFLLSFVTSADRSVYFNC